MASTLGMCTHYADKSSFALYHALHMKPINKLVDEAIAVFAFINHKAEFRIFNIEVGGNRHYSVDRGKLYYCSADCTNGL